MAPKRRSIWKGASAAKRRKVAAGDPLKLHDLFKGAHGAKWEAPVREALEGLPAAGKFIGPSRHKDIVPPRELTFQALKPSPPGSWRVVVFGQNPYPRLESATGIAMFDNSYDSWDDKRFGANLSMQCIVKAAAIAKYGTKPKNIEDLRALLRAKDIVSPSEWFQAMLAQGVVLLNAGLTVGGAGLSPADHCAFWRPVIERIVQTALAAKARAGGGGLAFAWWGAESLKTKKALSAVLDAYSDKVKIVHVEHANPAARGDAFCASSGGKSHFGQLNKVLTSVRLAPVEWLPDRSWLKRKKLAKPAAVAAMGDFIAQTKELHSRLKSAGAKFSTKRGAIAISLMWDHSSEKVRNDLDLHVTTPSKERIYFAHKKSKCGGVLDVDRMQDAPKPVENTVWVKSAPKGRYVVKVHNYSSNHSKSMPFLVGIVIDGGEMELRAKTMSGKKNEHVHVKTFEYK